MKTNSIHNPVMEFPVGDGKARVTVRELCWPDAMHLYNQLLGQTKNLFDEKGNFILAPQQMVDAVTQNIELGIWLVKKSAGVDDDWIAKAPLSQMLDLATEAAVLNIGIIVGRIKNARSRLREVVAGASETSNTTPGDSTASSPTSRSS